MNNNTTSSKKTSIIFFGTFFLSVCILSVVHFFILVDLGTPPSRALADGIVSYLLLGAACLMVINNMRYYLPKQEKYWYILVISIALSLLWLLAFRISMWAIFKLDNTYLLSLSQTSFIRFILSFLLIGCCTLLSLLWFTQQNLQEDEDRKQAIEIMARESELHKLKQQLQPHFLFNSLNSISALTASQPEKARHMIQQLSDFLRGSLKKEDQQWTTLSEELEYVQLYLEIEKVRFGYRLQTTVHCEEATLKMMLPTMLLQPLVENAIKFGLYDTVGEVNIIINAKDKDGNLQVSVQNPFDATTAGPVKGTGFGLASIRRRLFLLFARHDLLETNNEAQQFISTINIPQQHESNHN